MRARTCAGAIAAIVALRWLALSATPVIEVGSRKQLFIDYKFVESAEGVTLVMNPPWRTGEVLVEPDASWETQTILGSYGTVVEENGRVRLWYQSLGKHYAPGKNPDFMGLAYAESDDGIHFRKPS
jgi:hypothetical protein